MGLPQFVIDQINDENDGGVLATVKRGEDIFEGVDYPRTFEGFVGQEEAKEELRIAALSARARGATMDHTMLASGLHGIGKTTLAHILAYEAEVGLVCTTGPLTAKDFWNLVTGMEDRDILFIDEIHRMVMGGRTKSDWLLPALTEWKLYSAKGAQEFPKVTVVGATTDVGVLPETLLSRFMTAPELVRYTPEEGARIAASLTARMHVTVPLDILGPIAAAADQNPRAMRKILSKIRDLQHAYPESHPNFAKALSYAGMSPDGLSKVARDMLLLLYLADDHTLAIASLRKKLNEPGPIDHHEQQLLQRQLIDITGRGRKLTEHGIARAREEARAR